jgi:hypothetical protein
MYQEDSLNYTEYNDANNIIYINSKNALEESKNIDSCYNKVIRQEKRPNGKLKNVKVELYSSNGTGKHIRDAETGVYYKNLVGSRDEDLFFKVVLATGECNGKNGSSTFFFTSPTQYMSHMKCEVSPETISNWEQKRNRHLNK